MARQGLLQEQTMRFIVTNKYLLLVLVQMLDMFILQKDNMMFQIIHYRRNMERKQEPTEEKGGEHYAIHNSRGCKKIEGKSNNSL